MTRNNKQYAIYVNEWHGGALVSEHADAAELEQALEVLEKRNTCQCYTMAATSGGCYVVIEREAVEDLEGRPCGYDLDDRERKRSSSVSACGLQESPPETRPTARRSCEPRSVRERPYAHEFPQQ